MKQSEIKTGGHYRAMVSGRLVTVRVDAIRRRDGWKREETVYDVTNLTTGRKTTFRSAQKFRGEVVQGGPVFGAAVDAIRQRLVEQVRAEAAPAIPAGTDAALAGDDGDDAPSAFCRGEEPECCESDAEPGEPCTACGKTNPPRPAWLQEAIDQAQAPAVETVEQPAAPVTGLGARVLARPEETATPVALPPAQPAAVVPETVAGMTPTVEQRTGLEMAARLFQARGAGRRVLALKAGAGAGKTAELKMMEQVLTGRGQYTAFNKSLVVDSKPKFLRARCNTTHSLAFGQVGRRYSHRLDAPRVRSDQVARLLGIEAMTITAPPTEVGGGETKLRTLQAGFLAGQVLVAVKKFSQSADREVTERHFRYIDGIDFPAEDGRRGHANNDRVREYLLPFARLAWADLTDPQGQLPYTADYYVKEWQLGTGEDRPHIAADYILLDEYQDTAEVFIDILKQQTHALLVLVGDDNQRIYEWRGAQNAADHFPEAEVSWLTQSFRFGQAVADVANSVLATLEERTDLVMRGLPSIPSRVAHLDAPRCVLTRTNAGAVGTVLQSLREGKRAHLIGGGADVVAFFRAARDLQARRPTSHPELCCFESWNEVETYAATDEGEDLRLMVKLIKEFTVKRILEALEGMPEERDADLVVCTAHKSKGREWTTVKLAADFRLPNKMDDAERRLLYVAATRAQEQLDITACPAFTGGQDEEGHPVPGIRVKYTQEQPTAEQLEMYRAAKGQRIEVPASTPTNASPVEGSFEWCQAALAAGYGSDNPPPAGWKPYQPSWTRKEAPPAPKANGNGNSGEFTWANLGEGWVVRGPAGKEGQTVTVTRKDGSTSKKTLRNVVKKLNDKWFYNT